MAHALSSSRVHFLAEPGSGFRNTFVAYCKSLAKPAGERGDVRRHDFWQWLLQLSKAESINMKVPPEHPRPHSFVFHVSWVWLVHDAKHIRSNGLAGLFAGCLPVRPRQPVILMSIGLLVRFGSKREARKAKQILASGKYESATQVANAEHVRKDTCLALMGC